MDTVTISPGHEINWRELWYPVAGIGGVSTANEHAALHLEALENDFTVGLYTITPQENVDLYLWQTDCSMLGHWSVAQVGPDQPFRSFVPTRGLHTDQASLVALSPDGNVLAAVNPQDCLPPKAGMEPLPSFTTVPTISLRWHGSDVWSGVASYDLEYREGYEGAWTGWLTHTRQLSTTFVGMDGQTYFFRVRAQDEAGNISVQLDDEWGQAFTSVLLTPAPVLLTSRKLAHPQELQLGELVQYHLLVKNTGNLTATAVVLTDHLPNQMRLLTDTLTAGLVSGTLRLPWGDLLVRHDGLLLWRGTIPLGKELDLAYQMAASPATPAGVGLTNTFWLAADGIDRIRRWAEIVYHRRRYFLPLVSQDMVCLP
jgi:uncharacterized repeat protein (TIGR01451 family)